MSASDAPRDPLSAIGSIPRDSEGPVFPAPWAARAFALTVSLHARGLFQWPEWSAILGAKVARIADDGPDAAEAYWHAWLAALEEMLASKRLAGRKEIAALQRAWREAAERTPHGEPVVLERPSGSAE